MQFPLSLIFLATFVAFADILKIENPRLIFNPFPGRRGGRGGRGEGPDCLRAVHRAGVDVRALGERQGGIHPQVKKYMLRI